MLTKIALSALVALPILQTAQTAQAAPNTQDAPVRLITQQGVELRADEQVFVLFAALNAMGYAEETQRKGPPLRAPVFHQIRVEVRDALRKSKEQPSVAAVKALFEKNPAEIETYLEAVLGRESGAKLSKEAAKLSPKLKALEAFRKEANLTKLFDTVAIDQRNHAKELKKRLEKDFAETAKMYGMDSLRSPLTLVVVPNPLDGHAVVRSVTLGKTVYLVVGPGFESAQDIILKASLKPVMVDYVTASYAKARRFAKHWSGLKTSKRITRRYPSGEVYLAETLTRAITFRVRGKLNGKANREADEEFIDEQAKDSLRWARAALKLLDKHKAGASFKEALPGLLARIQI